MTVSEAGSDCHLREDVASRLLAGVKAVVCSTQAVASFAEARPAWRVGFAIDLVNSQDEVHVFEFVGTFDDKTAIAPLERAMRDLRGLVIWDCRRAHDLFPEVVAALLVATVRCPARVTAVFPSKGNMGTIILLGGGTDPGLFQGFATLEEALASKAPVCNTKGFKHRCESKDGFSRLAIEGGLLSREAFGSLLGLLEKELEREPRQPVVLDLSKLNKKLHGNVLEEVIKAYGREFIVDRKHPLALVSPNRWGGMLLEKRVFPELAGALAYLRGAS